MRIPPWNLVLNLWPDPNYDDPVTQGPSLIIVNAVFMTLVVLAVAGRFYSRLCIQKWFGVDDAMMVLAFVSDPNNLRHSTRREMADGRDRSSQ